MNIDVLSEEIMNGKIYKSAKVESTAEPVQNNLELKICYQVEDDAPETEIMLSNEKCTYKVPTYKETDSLSSASSQISQVNSSMAWMKVQTSDTCSYATTYCEQFSILLCRMLKQIFRNRQGMFLTDLKLIDPSPDQSPLRSGVTIHFYCVWCAVTTYIT